MLFKHKHLLAELRQKGCKATGEILSMKTLGEASGIKGAFSSDEDLGHTWYDCRMVLRVVPEDRAEPPFEATVLTRIHTLKSQGSHVPVWYDPANHAKVVVDYEADLERITNLTAQIKQQSGISERSAHRTEQRVGVAWTPVDDVLVPIEAIPRPGSGRVQVTDWPVDVVHQSANDAVGFVRTNAATLLPPRDGGWEAWFAGHDFRIFQSYGPVPATDGASDASNIGIGVALAVLSALTGHMVRYEVSVAGVLAPSGELLPVASLKNVAHVASRAFAQRLVASVGNERELDQVPAKVKQNLEIAFAGSLKDAMRLSLTKHAVKGFQLPA